MTKADTIFKENITKIMEEGVWSEQARPKYKDGTTANSKYITGAFAEYDLSKGEFPNYHSSSYRYQICYQRSVLDLSRPDKQPRCP